MDSSWLTKGLECLHGKSWRPITTLKEPHLNELLSLLKGDDYFVRSCAAKSLGQLSQKTETILLAVVQGIEHGQQTDEVPTGSAIDVLWAIVVE